MKNLIDCLKPVNEGWTGTEGEKAYDEILRVFEDMKAEDILNLIWNYLDVDTLKNIYKWMKQDEYFD